MQKVPKDFPYKNFNYCGLKKPGPFGPHNPEELYFELEMENKPLGTTEDCVVDDRGYIYVNTMHDGVYILKCLV